MTGNTEPDEEAQAVQRDDNIAGLQFEQRIQGAPRTMTMLNQSAGDERGIVNLVPLTGWGSMLWPFALKMDVIPVEKSKWDRYQSAPTKKIDSFLDEVSKLAEETVVDSVSKDLWATGAGTAPAQNVVGSIMYAASDGVSAGETSYNNYGLIDRSLPENSDFRSYVNPATGNLTTRKLAAANIKIKKRHGTPKFGVCNDDVYLRVQECVEGFLDATIDGDYVEFGGAMVRYSGVTYMLDAYAAAQTLIVGDPDGLVFKDAQIPRTDAGFVMNPSLWATRVMHYGGWFQMIAVQPNLLSKLAGIL